VEGMLRTGGIAYEVVHVETLEDAKIYLRNSRVACTLLDLMLPDADGLDGLVALRNISPDVPVVVVTADDDESRAVKAVQGGAQDYLIKGRMDSEQLCRSVRYAIERHRSELLLAHNALHDPLTGLPNRTLFEDRLSLALAHSQRHDWSIALFFLDLDGFKQINDRFGHLAGDGVLRTVAGRMLAALRPGDTVGRFGGDEFTVLCGEIESEADVVRVATRLTESIRRPVSIAGDEVTLSPSIGIALVRRMDKPEAVIRLADQAMYRAKRRSGENYEVIADG
jgi:diguanylate cyclase (GGDEF)-like protein